MNIKRLALPGVVGLAAFAGVAGGSALTSLMASADTSTSATNSSAQVAADTTTTQPDPSKGGHQANGITETVLTGDTSTKAIAAAQAAEPGATVIRAETDAEGATYEVHMKKSDGSTVTVKLDANFKVTSTEDGFGPGPGSRSQSSPTAN